MATSTLSGYRFFIRQSAGNFRNRIDMGFVLFWLVSSVSLLLPLSPVTRLSPVSPKDYSGGR